MDKNRNIESNCKDIWEKIYQKYVLEGDVSKASNLDSIIEEFLPEFVVSEENTIEDFKYWYLKRRITIEMIRIGLNSIGGSNFVDAEMVDEKEAARALYKAANGDVEKAKKHAEKIRNKLERNQNFMFHPLTGEIIDPVAYEEIINELDRLAAEG